jgi:hypothetical protein
MFDSFQPIKGCSDGLIGCSNTSDKQSDCGQHLKRSPQRNCYCLIGLLISQNRFQSGRRTRCDNEKKERCFGEDQALASSLMSLPRFL